MGEAAGDILQTLRQSRNLLALRKRLAILESVVGIAAWGDRAEDDLPMLQVCRELSAAATFIGRVRRLS